MTLRCVLDGLLLPAGFCQSGPGVLTFDGDESFRLEALEALFYELVSATREEIVSLERLGYRFLRRAPDFNLH